MIIRWHDGVFLAEFARDRDLWAKDLEAAKSAGFKTSGPPEWLWTTQKIKPLLYLREHRPESGLEITNEALEHFQILFGLYQQNEAVLAEIKKAKKVKARAKRKEVKKSALIELIVPEKGFIDASDLPLQPFIWAWQPPDPPRERCLQCDDPLYAPIDWIDQGVCYWCY